MTAPAALARPCAEQPAATLGDDGSVGMTWTNHLDGTDPIPIWLKQADGTWKVVATVPAGTTSFHLPPQ